MAGSAELSDLSEKWSECASGSQQCSFIVRDATWGTALSNFIATQRKKRTAERNRQRLQEIREQEKAEFTSGAAAAGDGAEARDGGDAANNGGRTSAAGAGEDRKRAAEEDSDDFILTVSYAEFAEFCSTRMHKVSKASQHWSTLKDSS